LLRQNLDRIDTDILSFNPAAMDLLSNFPDLIDWDRLSANPSAIKLLRENQDRINWRYLSLNPEAIYLLRKNIDKIDWNMLSGNPAAIDLLRKNQDQINWHNLSSNPAIFDDLGVYAGKIQRGFRKSRDYAVWAYSPQRLAAQGYFDNIDLIDTLPVFKQQVTGKRERSPHVDMVNAKRYRNSFGKKRRVAPKRKSKVTKVVTHQEIVRVLKLAKKLKIKVTVKRGGKRVYKLVKDLKKEIKKARAKNSAFGQKRKSAFGKKHRVTPKQRKSGFWHVTDKKVTLTYNLAKKLNITRTTTREGQRVYRPTKELNRQIKEVIKKQMKKGTGTLNIAKKLNIKVSTTRGGKSVYKSTKELNRQIKQTLKKLR
jgi:hypothetical protein